MDTGIESAGASAQEQAELFDSLIDSTERQVATLLEAITALRRRQRNFAAGSEGERRAAARVQEVLVGLGSSAWHLLPDRRWPGTRRANLDLLLVGPPGVVVLDAKLWREPRIEGGSLWRGQDNCDDEFEKVRGAADSVADVLADIGLAPTAVHPMILLMGQHVPPIELAGVTVVGEHRLQQSLVGLGARLDPRAVEEVAATLDEQCPPAAKHRSNARATVVPAPSVASEEQAPDSFVEQALLESGDIWSGVLEQARREPIEAWMTWLHPAQAHLVTRSYSGPARIRGAAGTGKTVLALHRARYLSREAGSSVLFTSYVRTLPAVHRELFVRLAPDQVERVEFRSLHSWAARLLQRRKQSTRIAPVGGRLMFRAVWGSADTSSLTALHLPEDYWWDEVQQVVKGRGLTSFEQYLELTRIGRRTPLREEQRATVWQIFEAYQAELALTGHCDFADLLSRALDQVRRDPPEQPYGAVIVDEVQDLTCTGLQLAHALVGDAPDGLLLVGDGQQSVYPGGLRLSEAGVSVAGRATVLSRNYRNRAEILAAALEVVEADTFDDLDAGVALGARTVESEQDGGLVVRVLADDASSQRAALLSALRWALQNGVRSGDVAVLARDNREVKEWQRVLTGAGVDALLLEDYDGRTGDEVKVGTYLRSKGLEFACVFLPDQQQAVPVRREGEPEEAYRERASLARRQLFVAMTRARDRLWLGARP